MVSWRSIVARWISGVFGLILMCFGPIILWPAVAQAQGAFFGGQAFDQGQPIEVLSDELSVDQQAGTARFIGNVVMTQGMLKMAAAELFVENERLAGAASNKIARMVAKGGVLLTSPTSAAEGQEAVYDVASGQIVMTGDVLLSEGVGAISGQRMTVSLATGKAVVEGRVRTTLQPGAAQ